MSAFLIRGVLLYGEGDHVDVLVDDGQIADIGAGLTIPDDADVVDATGQVLLPGFVDLHTHLREPGREYAEDIETGSAAAALGGYTAVFAMANTNPVAYSRARRMTSGSCTQMPSSENIRTWAAPAAIMPISVNCAPARPMVTAPTGCTSTSPTCWPRCHTWSVTTGLSATGLVLAIANTAV